MKFLLKLAVLSAGINQAVAGQNMGNIRHRSGGRLLNQDDLLDDCGSFRYDTFVGFENDHLHIFATPIEDLNLPSECNAVSFHLNDPSTKEVLHLNATIFEGGGLFPIGTFEFNQLISAYESVDPNDSPYDVVNNNCAELVLVMLCKLGVPVEQNLLDWTVQRMLSTEDNKEQMLKLLRESRSLSDLGIEEGTAPQESHVAVLVKTYVTNFQCEAPDNVTFEESSSTSLSIGMAIAATLGTVIPLVGSSM